LWWRDAVVYQIYPRSFQDSDGDGVGDLRGITQRLDHLSWLGVDAFWLSPIYPSPLADFGYDVSDYTGVDPQLGTLAELDELVAAAHERGLRVLLDLIPCHTSIEHPWFREHPDWYIWSPVDGPPNNWVSAFGGPAWSRDEQTGRWYLHSFYPEQPDLDWRNPEVVEAMQGVVRFWIERGVDGFRLDAIDRLIKDAELRDDPPASGDFPLPLREDAAKLKRVYSGNRPEVVDALGAIREAAREALLVGEVFLPTSEYPRYLEVLDLVFAFELLFSPWDAERLRPAIEPAAKVSAVAFGSVYLLKGPGRRYKIGRTNAFGRRRRELSIQLPFDTRKVHVIETDDPVGVESYWHQRFAAKRINSEWFELEAADVAAFKRWKRLR